MRWVILLLGLFSVVRLYSGLSRRGGLDATMIDGTQNVVPASASERSQLRQPYWFKFSLVTSPSMSI